MYQFQGAHSGPPPAYQQAQPQQYGNYPPSPQQHQSQQSAYSGYQPSQTIPYGAYPPNQTPQQSSFGTASQPPPFQSQRPAQTAASTSQSCYNCGNPDHWAQNCPEPRRAIPHGAINNPRPVKRQKTTGPIITRYPVPPNHQPHPTLQRGFTHPPVGRQPFAPPGGLPQPIHGNPQNQQYWQTPNPQFYSQSSQQSPQQWSPATTSTPVSAFPPPYASPVPFAPATSQPPHVPHQSPHSAHTSPMPTTSYSSMTSQLRRPSNGFENRAQQKPFIGPTRPDSGTSNQPQLASLKVESAEPWLEELLELDFSEDKPGAGPKVSHPANPVAEPLPSSADVADAIGRLPIAASLPPGVPVSKHFRDLDLEKFEQNFRDGDCWSSQDPDPVFVDVLSGTDFISVQDLVSKRKEEALVLAESDDEDGDNGEAREPMDDTGHADQRSVRSDSVSDNVEHNSSLSRVSPHFFERDNNQSPINDNSPYDLHRRTEIVEEDRRVRRNTAAISTEDTARQDQAPRSPEQYNRDNRNMPNSNGFNRRRSSISPNQPGRSLSYTRSTGRTRDESHVSVSITSNGFNTPASPQAPRENSSKQHYGQASHPRSQDQTKSPYGKARRYFDGPQSNQTSPTDRYSGTNPANGNRRTPPDDSTSAPRPKEFISPRRSRSDQHLNRKRSYRQSSDESDGGPKRQDDDNLQRGKRKQPKIAAAYGRRW